MTLLLTDVVYVRWMWCRSCRCIRPLRLRQAAPNAWLCRVCQTRPLEVVR